MADQKPVARGTRRLFGTVLVAAVVACSAVTEKGPVAVSVRLKWYHQAQFAGLYAAGDRGFYRDSGLDVTLREGGRDANAVTMVASGSDTFGVWGADQVLIARSRGIPIMAVGVIFQESPVCFFAAASSGIRTPWDFVGRTVGMQYGTNVRTEYVAMMRRTGIPLQSVIEFSSGYSLQSFLEGHVDVWNGYEFHEPLLAEREGVPVRVIKPADYGVDMYADTLIARETMVIERPEVVAAFVQATMRGWRYALTNEADAVEMVLERNPRSSSAHESAMLAALRPLILGRGVGPQGIGTMDGTVWAAMLAEIEAQGLGGDEQVVLEETFKTFTNGFLSLAGSARSNEAR